MENRLRIFEPVTVLTTCVDKKRTWQGHYYYCGNGLLAYFNPDTSGYEVFGKFNEENGPSYYIPVKYTKSNRLELPEGSTLSDFEASKVIDAETIDDCQLSKEGFKWFEKLKKEIKLKSKIGKKNANYVYYG